MITQQAMTKKLPVPWGGAAPPVKLTLDGRQRCIRKMGTRMILELEDAVNGLRAKSIREEPDPLNPAEILALRIMMQITQTEREDEVLLDLSKKTIGS